MIWAFRWIKLRSLTISSWLNSTKKSKIRKHQMTHSAKLFSNWKSRFIPIKMKRTNGLRNIQKLFRDSFPRWMKIRRNSSNWKQLICFRRKRYRNLNMRKVSFRMNCKNTWELERRLLHNSSRNSNYRKKNTWKR